MSSLGGGGDAMEVVSVVEVASDMVLETERIAMVVGIDEALAGSVYL